MDLSNQWTSNIVYIMEYANKKNREGQIYPIWATCLGYKTLMFITSGSTDKKTVFTDVTGQDGKTCPLIVQNENSELLHSLNTYEYNDAITGDGIFFFHHLRAILLETYHSNKIWKDVWNLISTSKLENGTEFLTTLESK